jgi:hypothetical protein
LETTVPNRDLSVNNDDVGNDIYNDDGDNIKVTGNRKLRDNGTGNKAPVMDDEIMDLPYEEPEMDEVEKIGETFKQLYKDGSENNDAEDDNEIDGNKKITEDDVTGDEAPENDGILDLYKKRKIKQAEETWGTFKQLNKDGAGNDDAGDKNEVNKNQKNEKLIEVDDTGDEESEEDDDILVLLYNETETDQDEEIEEAFKPLNKNGSRNNDVKDDIKDDVKVTRNKKLENDYTGGVAPGMNDEIKDSPYQEPEWTQDEEIDKTVEQPFNNGDNWVNTLKNQMPDKKKKRKQITSLKRHMPT